MRNDDWINDDDNRYFYEHYEHTDYYGNLPKMHKTKNPTTLILLIIGIIIAIATGNSPAVLVFYVLFVASGKLSGFFSE